MFNKSIGVINLNEICQVVVVEEHNSVSLNQHINEVLEKYKDRQTHVGNVAVTTVSNFGFQVRYTVIISIGREIV